jgi:hypothetical protein
MIDELEFWKEVDLVYSSYYPRKYEYLEVLKEAPKCLSEYNRYISPENRTDILPNTSLERYF